jgi:hypothetical protein
MRLYRQNDLRSLISNGNLIGHLRVDAAEGSDNGEHAEWVDRAEALRRVGDARARRRAGVGGGGARVAELVAAT